MHNHAIKPLAAVCQQYATGKADCYSRLDPAHSLLALLVPRPRLGGLGGGSCSGIRSRGGKRVLQRWEDVWQLMCSLSRVADRAVVCGNHQSYKWWAASRHQHMRHQHTPAHLLNRSVRAGCCLLRQLACTLSAGAVGLYSHWHAPVVSLVDAPEAVLHAPGRAARLAACAVGHRRRSACAVSLTGA